MSNIRLYTIDGAHWLGVEFKNKLYLISYLGKIGDCISPFTPRVKLNKFGTELILPRASSSISGA